MWEAKLPTLSCFEASKYPKAIGRSKAGPCFLMSAGARLTISRLFCFLGGARPAFLIAAETRSFASLPLIIT